ncbi:zinc ribbon domain-containing protein [Edwardsiella piscicida]|uniref:zinc ribbon domain-containing protein n=1 Tax=Edwardsiella piscicida TaxID=1263550 RepID=UPI0010A6A86C|nr:zinc ribbon domain-containing protein [Edwardsiella piscicida]ELM3730325.1 zinc ribbon domain-containing protein [Edwardsiella piscicida]ELV7537560.1 zinc ribbon domain-containing protein [Edwardsiella piscicida]
MQASCPQCQHELQWQQDGGFFCPSCRQAYRREALCPQCQQPLQVLKACGAVDYFCSHGHGLISKKQVHIRYISC